MQRKIYTVEELMLDDSFLGYCLNNDSPDKDFWESVMADNHDQRAIFEEARHTIILLNGKLNDQEVATLTEDLKGYFDRAVSPQKPTGEERDTDDRRRSIADLLYNLDATPEGRTRTQTVVGMVHYINAADRQYANLRTMSDRLRAAIAAEQKTFIGAYQAVKLRMSCPDFDCAPAATVKRSLSPLEVMKSTFSSTFSFSAHSRHNTSCCAPTHAKSCRHQ